MADKYETVIGLEVHSQLLTTSKMFCPCGSDYQDSEPNTRVCPVCMGMPGVLPVVNKKAVDLVIKTGLALNCHISPETKFDRKNYPYPDLMKGYQISQFDIPIALDGNLAIQVGNADEKHVGITRVHLEEDVAKLIHRKEPYGEPYSLLDINRAGVPLMEIVSEPDMRSPEEARSYLTILRSILRYIGASTANMEEGSFRCDANISLRPSSTQEFGVKVEIKNMNSFRAVYNALVYETKRQAKLLNNGEIISQETRGWVENRGVTVSQRSKEYAADYRYFPEPDLPPLAIEQSWIDEVQSKLPELPQERSTRYVNEYGLSTYDADLLTASKLTADYFETVMKDPASKTEDLNSTAKSVSNWILGELTRLLHTHDRTINDLEFETRHFIGLIRLIDKGTLSNSMAKTVFEEMFKTGGSPEKIADSHGLIQISDTDVVESAVNESIDGNPQPVADYLGGKDTAIQFLVGQVMRITKGKANPQIVSDLLKEKLDSMR